MDIAQANSGSGGASPTQARSIELPNKTAKIGQDNLKSLLVIAMEKLRPMLEAIGLSPVEKQNVLANEAPAAVAAGGVINPNSLATTTANVVGQERLLALLVAQTGFTNVVSAMTEQSPNGRFDSGFTANNRQQDAGLAMLS